MRNHKKRLVAGTLLLSCIAGYQAAKAQAIANSRLNIVYTAVDNPIDVGMFGYDCKDVTLKADVGEVIASGTDAGCGHYMYRTGSNATGTVLFSLFAVKKGKAMLVASARFRIKHPPSPQPQIGDIMQPQTTLGHFKEQIGMIAVVNNFDFDVRYSVLRFDYRILRADKTIAAGTNTGAKFDADFIKNRELLQPGDVLLFEHIYSKNTTDPEVALADFQLRITE